MVAVVEVEENEENAEYGASDDWPAFALKESDGDEVVIERVGIIFITLLFPLRDFFRFTFSLRVFECKWFALQSIASRDSNKFLNLIFRFIQFRCPVLFGKPFSVLPIKRIGFNHALAFLALD